MNKDEAEEALDALGRLKGISVAFNARMTLSEWKEGNLLFWIMSLYFKLSRGINIGVASHHVALPLH